MIVRVVAAVSVGIVLNSLAASAAGRVANTSLRIPLEPPVFGYTTETAFPELRFAFPLALVTPPGETNRLFVVEKQGVIVVVTNLAAPTRTVFLDLRSRVDTGGTLNDERGLLGLAFHPSYRTNRYFYVFYTGNHTTAAGTGLHDKLSRFEVSAENPDRALPTSEQLLIAQWDQAGNHNGGDIHFGPDGYLYVAVGDEGGARDQFNNSQRIDLDLFAGILRIDVDQRAGNLSPNAHPAVVGGYSIPADNPYVGATQFNGRPVDAQRVRTEFFAVGLRNPWRFSFDPDTGILYCGDVGQDAREEINIIVKGGNYGWAYREGRINGAKSSQAPAGFTSIPPIADYGRGSGPMQGASVTGGVVYRGQRLSQLTGAYVFADYVSDNIWMLRYDGTNATPFQRLTADSGLVGFGRDPRNGDVLMADHEEGRIKRLSYSAQSTGTPLPTTLASTGAFRDLTTLEPHAGIVPYELNLPFWSDGAVKRRWFAIPGVEPAIGFHPENNWRFPLGSIWVKHFELELTNGVPESARRLETRFLVRNGGGVYGITYRWNADQSDAALVPEEGLDEVIEVRRGGEIRSQVWRYPGRNECAACHTAAAGWVLGFTTPQLNRAGPIGDAGENQIAALARLGYFSNSVPSAHVLRAHPGLGDESVSVEARVRSYLGVNCANCHQPGGTARGFFDARWSTPTAEAGLIRGLLFEGGGLRERLLLDPGAPENSALLARIKVRGRGQMPPVASAVVDAEAAALLSSWIAGDATNWVEYADWARGYGLDAATALGAESGDADGDGASNLQEHITGTNPTRNSDSWGITASVEGEKIMIRFRGIANRGFEVQVTDDPAAADSWRALDASANRPRFRAEDADVAVEDALQATGAKFYRVRVFRP